MNNSQNREEIVKFYVAKAWNTLKDAMILSENKAWESCVNRLYYACFYMVYALLIQKIDVRAKTHSGIKTLFGLHIVKEGLIDEATASFYPLVFERRNEADYEDFEILTVEDVLPLISQAEEFIKTIQKLIL